MFSGPTPRVVTEIIDWLRNDSSHWSKDGHYWFIHSSGVCIWTANEMSGIRIHTSKSVDSLSWKPSKRDQRAIMRAIEHCGMMAVEAKMVLKAS